MITLTNPIQVPNSIGGTTKTNYNKLRVVSIVADPVAQTITAQIQILVSSDATQPIISGTLVISTQGSPSAVIQVPSLMFFDSPNIAASVSTVQGWITALQNSIESGLISTGAITGTQSTGV